MSDDIKQKLVDAALDHVVFDGWSDATFAAAIADVGCDRAVAKALCPRRALDLAVAYHRRCDQEMAARLAEADLDAMRFRDKVIFAVKLRLEICGDKEVVRRGTTLFALPQNAPVGAELIWGTSDAIWRALRDTSDDINWYSKRATLSAVYGSTVLYWLGDDSDGHAATWAFLERRIQNVMQFEKAKGAVKDSPVGKMLEGPLEALGRLRAPRPLSGFPGRWR